MVQALKHVGVVAGDRSKLRKITLEQISEWTRSKATPPLPSVLPHQRQSKEEMEAVLGSGNNERLITQDLVGLGLRGIYGGAMDLFARRISGTADDGGEAASAADGEAAVSDADAAVSDADAVLDLEIQATIYKNCVQRDGERRVLNELLRRRGDDSAYVARIKERLEDLDLHEVHTPLMYSLHLPQCLHLVA